MNSFKYLTFLSLIITQIYGKPYQETSLIKDFKRALTENGWFIGANGKQYHLSSAENGFYESGDACEKIGGSLVKILNEKDQESLNGFITSSKQNIGQYFWIGLREGSVAGAVAWIWQKDNAVATNFINWAPGQPGLESSLQDCGAVGTDGSWFTKHCDEKLFGICEKLGPLVMPVSAGQQQEQPKGASAPPKEASAPPKEASAPPQEALNGDASKGATGESPDKQPAAQEDKNESKEAEKIKKKFSNGERCNLVNFINHIGKPIKISRAVNDGQSKDYVVEGENYKLNTIFRKVENPLKMEPVIYTARQTENDMQLALDGKDSFTLMPGDCDGDFIDVIVSPLPVEEDIVAEQRSSAPHRRKSLYEKHALNLNSEQEDESVDKKRLCQVETFGGSSDSGCCHFPFRYNDRLYHDCTSAGKRHLWCGTTRDYDNDRRWGYCCLERECTN